MNRKETISILGGTGDLGTGLALRLLNAGYSIVIGSRTLKKAKKAKKSGASRFCMGAAWREVKDGPEFDKVIKMVKGIKKIGMENR